MNKLIRSLIFLLAGIGIIMVIRRSLAIEGLVGSFNPTGKGGPAFDADFARHPAITFIHILPGALFMLLGPLQFLPGFRIKYPKFHRRSGRLVIVCGYIIGLSALSLPFIVKPIGGLNEAAATTFFAFYFLIALTMAWRMVLRRKFDQHRQWMIRMFSIGLAVGTIRPIVALFFVFSGLPPQVFFGTAFWIGFTLHLILAEVWINYTRKS